LRSLIQYSFGEELRWNPARAQLTRAQHQPAARHQHLPLASAPKQWEPRKRPRDAVAAAAVPAAGQASAGRRLKVPKVVDTRPVEQCQYYKYVGELTPEIKAVLSQFGLCWYCRCERHLAQSCPKKQQQQA